MQHRIAFPLAALFLLAACGEQDPVSTLSANASAGGANPIVLSARGSAHVEGPTPGGTNAGWRVFTFSAVKRADGTVTGRMQYDTHDEGNQAGNVRQVGEVICMSDLGDGWIFIGARGTSRTAGAALPGPIHPLLAPATPASPGMLFVVRDNGEGNRSDPDELTGVAHLAISAPGPVGVLQLCAAGAANPLKGLLPVFAVDAEAGNVQTTGTE